MKKLSKVTEISKKKIVHAKSQAPPSKSKPRNKARLAAKQQLIRFTRRFLLGASLLIPVSMIPEAWYAPFNRLIAHFVSDVLNLFLMRPFVRGTYIHLNGFVVNVIAECSAIHLVVLYAAFISAFPAPIAKKWTGLAAGVILLMTVNVIRIATVTWIGWQFPALFDAAHIYLGQLVMLTVMIVICLTWCRWSTETDSMDGPGGFLLRFILFTSIPFLLWLPLNVHYMAFIDRIIQWIFSLFSQTIVIPRTHHYYYQTFSLITVIGILAAVKGVRLGQRLRWMAYSIGGLTLLQVTVRLCNVGFSAFHIGWIVPISQVFYAACVYALPLIVAFFFLMRLRTRRAGRITK